MEEAGVLSGDNAYNAHFGESIAAIGDIDDDGFQGQWPRSSRGGLSVTRLNRLEPWRVLT